MWEGQGSCDLWGWRRDKIWGSHGACVVVGPHPDTSQRKETEDPGRDEVFVFTTGLGGPQHGTWTSLITVCVIHAKPGELLQAPLSSHFPLATLHCGSSLLVKLHPRKLLSPEWSQSFLPPNTISAVRVIPYKSVLSATPCLSSPPGIYQDQMGRRFTSLCCLVDSTPTLCPSELPLSLPFPLGLQWQTGHYIPDVWEKGMKNSLTY